MICLIKRDDYDKINDISSLVYAMDMFEVSLYYYVKERRS